MSITAAGRLEHTEAGVVYCIRGWPMVYPITGEMAARDADELAIRARVEYDRGGVRLSIPTPSTEPISEESP